MTTEDSTKKCTIPFCDNETHKKKGIKCGQQHSTCNECFKRLLTMEIDKFEGPTGAAYLNTLDGFKIICPLESCSAEIDHEKIADKISNKKSLLKRFFKLSLREAKRKGKQEGMAMANVSTSIVNDTISFQESISAVFGETTAGLYSCTKCNCGPVELKGCNDLTAHQGEGNTDNRCPACGNFEPVIENWKPYDGKVYIPTPQEIELLKENAPKTSGRHRHMGSLHGCGGNPDPLSIANSRGGGNCSDNCTNCGAGTHWTCCGLPSSSGFCSDDISRHTARSNVQRCHSGLRPSYKL